jgi:hypothetical protein
VVHSSPDWSKKRFIYTEVIAALSILLALFWLIPFSGGFIHWPVDVLLSIGWFVAFGLLVNVSWLSLYPLYLVGGYAVIFDLS